MNVRILLLTLLIAVSACKNKPEPINDGRINDYSALINEFKDPGVDYRPAPLWVWNNEVSREDIDLSLAELKN